MNQKRTIIALFILLVIVIAGAIGYFVWAQKSLTTPTAQQPANQQPSTKDETANWKIYKNTEYGFQLTLNDSWKGYQVTKSSKIVNNTVVPPFTLVSLAFEVPTKDKNFGGGSGWVAPFYIEIFPKDAWNKSQQAGLGGPPDYLTENDKYVFTYETWQDTPSDIIGSVADYNLKSTFKFTK